MEERKSWVQGRIRESADGLRSREQNAEQTQERMREAVEREQRADDEKGAE